MIYKNLVEVQYYHPEIDAVAHTVGEFREGSQHILLLSGEVAGGGIYSYIIIPKNYVKKIAKLRLK